MHVLSVTPLNATNLDLDQQRRGCPLSRLNQQERKGNANTQADTRRARDFGKAIRLIRSKKYAF
jgi:hypothetical protein